MSNGNIQRDSYSEQRTWVEGPERLGRPRLLIKNEDVHAVRQAFEDLSGPSDAHRVATQLLEALNGQVLPTTLYAIRAQLMAPGTTPLAHQAYTGQARVVLSFAGQALSYFEDLERLYEVPAARRIIEVCSAALLDELESGARLEGYHPNGLDLVGWLTDPHRRPDDQTLSSGPISQPLIFVTQVAQLAAMERFGFAPEKIADWAVGVTGHSQGIVTAMIAAEAHGLDALAQRAAQMARCLVWQGIAMQAAYARAGDTGAGMVAITGQTRREVDDARTGLAVNISLINAPRRFVLSGLPDDLKRVVKRLERRSAKEHAGFDKGLTGRPRPLGVEWLSVSAPFHSEVMRPSIPAIEDAYERLQIDFKPERLRLPVIRYEDGTAWTGQNLVLSQTVHSVDWHATIGGAIDLGATHMIDAGPGMGVSAISALCVRGHGIQVIPAATDVGEDTLLARDSTQITPPTSWLEYAPKAIEGLDGTTKLVNAFTKRTQRPPIFLPGMTPTTVEAPIVAAAANAGYMAELAGGGQPTEAIFRKRAEELRSALNEGEGYVVNTLYLDPYLWGLHIGKERVVQKLKAEGHPILGVTISAGIPPVDEAVALLTEFKNLGMTLNSLKVGNDDQVRQSLAIADATAETLILQVEGGKAGGHHSFDSLPELLLTWYPRIRRRKNVLLTVGGGIGHGEQVRDYLTGRWSQAYGRAPMPVDAVYLGTALMAAKEACTAPAVKEALVAAQGTDQVVGRGRSIGGIRSGLSGLGADIHYLDNHAAKTASFLDTVAGDASAVAAHKETIIEMLSKTAKPYFGELDGLTYADLLHRLLTLMAIGRNGAYEDGIWLDMTHRSRFGRMLRRALQRCDFSGALPSDDALDAPTKLLQSMLKACPALDSRPVTPEDRVYFVNRICRAPGKPVPFVPIIDENVRKWYCSDALWQAHDDRYDADAVLIIPGPEAVSGIHENNVPVATLMASYLRETIESVPAHIETTPPDLVGIAQSAEQCLFNGRPQNNPIARLLEGHADGVVIETTTRGVRLKVDHQLPVREPRPLTLDFIVEPNHPFPLRAAPNFTEQLRRFYRDIMPDEVGIDSNRIAAYRRTSEDLGTAIPQQLFFATALPQMMNVILDARMGLDPLSLLHIRSHIEHLDPEASGPFDVELSEPFVRDDAGGRRIQLRGEIKQDGRCVVVMSQEFLVRSYTGRAPKAYYVGESIVEHKDEGQPLARPRPLFDTTVIAPVDLTAFAHISGDLNPIHRDDVLAELAGLPCPIVHGQWTAATMCARLVNGGQRLKWSEAQFLAPVMPGSELKFSAQVVARIAGDEIVTAEVTSDNTPVLQLRARLSGAPTALVFPGQGSQRRGMGMEGYERSAAARAIWDKADRHTRSTYGFSLLEVVRANPKTIDVGQTVVRHPNGVLNVTQFTQVALTVLSCAGVAELREAGACPDSAWFCGHSVGEYSALSAVTDVLPLDALIDVVYHRGLTMQRFVDRDELGRSEYAMGVIRPHKVGLDGPQAIEWVAEVADDTGLPLYVVNHNVKDRQYAVAGHLTAIDALTERLRARAPSGDGWVTIPGIDVPFHSPLLTAGVPAFREVLERCIPEDVDIDRLVGRYVPNLVAMPFELNEDFVEAVWEATGHDALLAFKKAPSKHGRAILIELLAWQFASPVRWIETQEYLANAVDAIVEIGPTDAPVLSNMFLSGMRHREQIPQVLHAGRDYLLVIGVGPEPVEEAETSPTDLPSDASPTPIEQQATVSAPAPVASVSAGPIEDEPWGIDNALMALLALRVGKSMDALKSSDTVDGLLGGNSARRNQVLLDLGKEFGIGPVDGAHELPLGELIEALTRSGGARYRHPGAILKAAQTQALGTLGQPKKAADARLETEMGLGQGRRAAVLTTLAVEVDTLKDTADPLKAAARAYARRAGIDLDQAQSVQSVGAQVDAGALAAAQDALKSQWVDLAKVALKAGGLDPTIIDAENSAPSEPVQPVSSSAQSRRFDAQKHVAFTTIEQWAQADLHRWYWALRAGKADAVDDQRIASRATPTLLAMLDYYCSTVSARTAIGKRLKQCRAQAAAALTTDLPWSAETALVTGAGPDSIGEAITARLLEGGARVIVTTSRPSRARIARFKGLYRRHAARGAELHVVPFNQGDLTDIDALCEWLVRSDFETRGAQRVELKTPWLPTLCFPFGAVPAEGDPTTLDAEIAATLTVNLIGVEKLIGSLAREVGQRGQESPRVHVVLPLSPNHGQMGRDGLYAESKIGLETLLLRWEAEFDRWGRYTTLCGARIGWVRGTGLMHGLDRVYQTIEQELGIETYTPTQMADMILAHCTSEARQTANSAPQLADLTGGFGQGAGLRDLIGQALATATGRSEGESAPDRKAIPALFYDFPVLPDTSGTADISPSDVVAIVGFGEVGPFGNARIRWVAENEADLSMEAAVELAWLCGCIKFDSGEWLDVETGEPIRFEDLDSTYELSQRIGIRTNEAFDPTSVEAFTEVILSEDMTFHVPDAQLAESFRLFDPEHTVLIPDGDGCKVIRRAGGRIRVPRVAPIDRTIAGQLPRGFDASRLGFDAQQLEQIDPVAIYNLLATADAFRSAGLSPEELWTKVHPARIACSQGSGIGGMRALRRLYAESLLDQNNQSDVLQETLINVS
ncbi:MAG: fatty acid synthase subunit beta domain-containing protein, partial [Myxococcota bacterium]|nr:fatty acid synthase subunit beta domain-containing protein [Myxococcota bacterium]